MRAFQVFLDRKKIYTIKDLDNVLPEIRHYFRFSHRNQKQKYFNVPAAFDIETTSFYDADGNKAAIMYCWTFGIYGIVFFGRTWLEFVQLVNEIARRLGLNDRKRLVVYVHNLAFDFQFFRKHFSFIKVFAIDRRKPLYALTDTGIEFRCSYLLSGYGLAKLGDELTRYPVKKAVGDLDYSLIRHSKTEMTRKEINYCVQDVKVVMAYVQELIEDRGGIAHLPLTKTGFVRDYCRNACFYEPGVPRKKSLKRLRYHETMERLTLTPELYDALKRAFQGGFTHANVLYSGKTVKDVASYDFTSSYPAVMLAERFPMGYPEKIDTDTMTQSEFENNLLCYCCLFDIQFINIRERPEVYENYISSSRCFELKGGVINNGRVVRADQLFTTVTEQDFLIIKKFYEWDGFRVSGFYRWMRGYLPTDFVKAILKLYEDKTTLKGVAGKEQEYMVAKGMLNSCYGMAVTDIIREINDYDYNTGEWREPRFPLTEPEINKYNNSWSRFLYYPWGVWVTSYARRNLFTAIYEAGPDYVYSDTDSIKLRNAAAHADYFKEYDRLITGQLERAMSWHGIDAARIRPKTIKGIEKPLGVWDYEGTYTRFKTLGAKRYLTETNGKLSMTVAGLNKSVTLPYLESRYTNVFRAFRDGLFIPAGETGKQTHTYIDDTRRGYITDYRGRTAAYEELSCIHLEPAEYELGIAQEYKDYIKYMKGGFM